MAAFASTRARLLPDGHHRRGWSSVPLLPAIRDMDRDLRRSGHGNSVTPIDLRSCSPMSCRMSRSIRSMCIQRWNRFSPSRATLLINRSVPRQLAVRASDSVVRPTATAVRRSASNSSSFSRNSGLRLRRRSEPERRPSLVLSDRSMFSAMPSAPSATSSSRIRTISLTSRRRSTLTVTDSSANSQPIIHLLAGLSRAWAANAVSTYPMVTRTTLNLRFAHGHRDTTRDAGGRHPSA